MAAKYRKRARSSWSCQQLRSDSAIAPSIAWSAGVSRGAVVTFDSVQADTAKLSASKPKASARPWPCSAGSLPLPTSSPASTGPSSMTSCRAPISTPLAGWSSAAGTACGRIALPAG